MQTIRKTRREEFGAILYSENPGFTAYIGNFLADVLRIPKKNNLSKGTYRAPLDVHMSLTSRCNLNCNGCYALKNLDRVKDISEEKAKSIIDKLANMNIFTISFGGGEPLMHPKVFKIAEYCRSRKIVPNITTNGLLINKKEAENFHVFGNVHISLHNMDDVDNLTDAVKNLKRSNITPGLNLLISSETYGSIDSIFEWASKLKIKKIFTITF